MATVFGEYQLGPVKAFAFFAANHWVKVLTIFAIWPTHLIPFFFLFPSLAAIMASD